MRLARLLLVALFIPFLAACGGSDDEKAGDAGQCEYVAGGPQSKKVDLPPADPKSADELTIKLNRGDIKVTLTPDATPCTVNNFVSLAEQGYFDGTKCHRMIPGFVLQCGDPEATGLGGPGYSFADEVTGKEKYPAGTLAMANAGADTNGSQFFIVLSDEAGLDPLYTVFGEVDEAGLALAKKIEAEGTKPGPNDQPAPINDVIIESVS